ncbi:SUMO ligase siz1 [Tulasnella sp. 419]|nr:SUMO ligase siz1 [Tulasnella sp. 419]
MSDIGAIGSFLKSRVPNYTVDRLKGIITGLNEQCGASLNRTGKKSDLIQKIQDQIDDWVAVRNGLGDTSIKNAKAVFESMDAYGSYNLQDILARINDSTKVQMRSAPTPGSSNPQNRYGNTNGAGPSNSTLPNPSNGVPPPAQLQGIPFRQSPFFRIDQHISTITTCPESTSSSDRKSVNFDFMLTIDQRNKLLSQFPKYELRLYCTSSSYYSKPTAFYPAGSNNPAPVEFPNTCEIRVNNVALTANTRGLKKKAGTAPPPSIAREAKPSPGALNKVEMVYCNNQPQNQIPPPPKKYYLQVNLVEVTSSQQLMDKLKKGKYRSKDEVLADRKAQSLDDDDIVIGPQKMSVKCPLSYMRIATPTRSSKCVHIQCFDALSWFSMMEITTTWQCPICEQTLDVADLIVDGYFDSILAETPESVEEVMVEADGAWHSLDNKYHSVGWVPPPPKANSGSSSATLTPPIRKEETKPIVEDVKPIIPKYAEVMVLDSDEDEDIARVQKEIFPTASRPGLHPLPSRQSREEEVIDLTLDSDDEVDRFPPLPTTSVMNGKRKERSPTAASTSTNVASQTSKRSRMSVGDDGLTGGGSRSNSTFGDLYHDPYERESRGSYNYGRRLPYNYRPVHRQTGR